MENQMISVIIPVYNGEEYIAETIEHILASSYHDIEIVAVIDGAKDQSEEICRNIATKDDRVKVYTKENGGIASARNYGIEKARGEYICVCDQDDIVQPQMYERMIRALKTSNADMAFCSTGRWINGEIVEYETFEDAVYEGTDIYKQLLYPILFQGYKVPIIMSEANRPPSIWKTIAKKEFWIRHKLNFHSYVNYEDDLLVIVRMLCSTTSVATTSYRGYLWRTNLRSESHARKYIENIGEKQALWLKDIQESVKLTNPSEKIMDYVSGVTNCKLYVDAVLNACSPYYKKTMRELQSYFKTNIYERDFDASIKMAQYVTKQYPMQWMIIGALKEQNTYRCYWRAKMMLCLVGITERSKGLLRLDSTIKNIGKKTK